jgi:CheY-like chemotaxis protein
MSAPSTPRLRVLVVDADPHARSLFRTRLTEQGCDCQEAARGDEVVRLAASFCPDVVLLDVEAVEEGAYEAARRLSRSVLCPRPWLVALTGRADNGRAQEAGFDLLLTKPLWPANLEALLRACVAAGPAGRH